MCFRVSVSLAKRETLCACLALYLCILPVCAFACIQRLICFSSRMRALVVCYRVWLARRRRGCMLPSAYSHLPATICLLPLAYNHLPMHTLSAPLLVYGCWLYRFLVELPLCYAVYTKIFACLFCMCPFSPLSSAVSHFLSLSTSVNNL
jgi:hypothetical protein